MIQKCTTCLYMYICGGLSDEQREACGERR